VVRRHFRRHPVLMTSPSRIRRLRNAVAGLVAEDRTGFKRIDASPAQYDDGSWLPPRPLS
jgi:hypothetical protein